MTLACAVSLMSTSPLPKPESAPAALSCRPKSVNPGSAFAPPFKCTLEAVAGNGIMTSAATTQKTIPSNKHCFVNSVREIIVCPPRLDFRVSVGFGITQIFGVIQHTEKPHQRLVPMHNQKQRFGARTSLRFQEGVQRASLAAGVRSLTLCEISCG